MLSTYSDVYLTTRKKLKSAGVDAFALEARLIVAAAAGKTQQELLQDMKLYVSADYERKVEELVQRRLAGEPVAYIIGEWEFYGLPMVVTKDVLIPRMDTEVLVGKAIDLLRGREGQTRVLDLCCGSGCIGLAIAANVPDVRVTLVDNSPYALSVARMNTLKLNLSRSISCVEADVLKEPPIRLGSYDLIVCNPPYIPTGEMLLLDSSVRDYEPWAALDGGDDGLDFYRAVTPRWKPLLRDRGCILYECGEGQAEEIANILHKNGFNFTAFFKDTMGTDRVVAGVIDK